MEINEPLRELDALLCMVEAPDDDSNTQSSKPTTSRTKCLELICDLKCQLAGRRQHQCVYYVRVLGELLQDRQGKGRCFP